MDVKPTIIFPSLPHTERGVPVVLGTNPVGDKIVFCNGRCVYFVPLNKEEEVEIYTGHTCQTTVAKISPNGNYCASGDVKGNVRIWEITTKALKKEICKVFPGKIRDIAWDSESKRIGMVGETNDSFVKVFLLDTGTFVRNLIGHSNSAMSVDIKSTKPCQMVTGGTDFHVVLSEGTPLKYKTTLRNHEKNVNCTRYSPDGTKFATAGADGQLIIWENEIDATNCVEHNQKAQYGTISSIAWSPDGRSIAAAGLDKSIKIFDVESKKVIENLFSSKSIDDQQLGIIWTKEALVSVALDGTLRVYDPKQRLLDEMEMRCGHNKPITCMSKSADSKVLYTADNDGRIVVWNVENKSSTKLPWFHESRLIVDINSTQTNDLVTIAFDDTISFLPFGEFGFESTRRTIKPLPSQPRGFAVSPNGDISIVACQEHLVVFNNGNVSVQKVDFNPTSISALFSFIKIRVAVGGNDKKLRVYELVNNELTEVEMLSQKSDVVKVSFSDNGEYLAVVIREPRKLIVYNCNDFNAAQVGNGWCRHTGLIKCVSWSPDNRRIATGALDHHIYVYDVQKPSEEPFHIPHAHISDVNAIVWIDNVTMASAGEDSNVKIWNVPLKE